MTNKTKNTKLTEIVQIEKLVAENGTPVFLMKIADIPVRPYITEIEVNKVVTYMKTVVNAVVQKVNIDKTLTGKDLVNIEILKTKEGDFYLMTIADMHLRGYIDGYETLVQKSFMISVVDEVIKRIRL